MRRRNFFGVVLAPFVAACRPAPAKGSYEWRLARYEALWRKYDQPTYEQLIARLDHLEKTPCRPFVLVDRGSCNRNGA